MKTIDCEQRSIEWMMARLGMPTASKFDQILTPKTRKPSGSRTVYRTELLAEWLLGQPLDWGTTGYVERGMDLEDEARAYYALQRDVEVRQVGFITRDDGLVGGSTDGLVETDGVLEIKCLSAAKHVAAMLGETPDYMGQRNGYLYLTDRAWCDVIFYHPDLPAVITRFDRDEEYIAALLPLLDEFVERLEADKLRFMEHRVPRPWSEEPPS